MTENTAATTVRAFALDEFGASGSIREVPVRAPGEGEMVIRVHAAGVNPYDLGVVGGHLQSMMEHRFPLVPGIDAAGVVEEVGPGVTRFKVGDAVFGQFLKPHAGEGVFAEAVVVPAEGIVAHKPASIDFAQAAALGTPVLAAREAINALAPKQEDTVLVVGAAGGVGSYAIQLLARQGVRVIATGRPGQEEYLRGLGATEVIDFTSQDVTDAVKAEYPEGIDGLIDLVHRTPAELTEQAAVVRWDGRVASTMNAVDAEALGQRGIAGTNVMAGSTATPQDLEALADMVARAELHVPIAHVFALEETPAAFERLQSESVQGKIVIEPQR
jgi:NADPH:quinone reductase-like Zn-dependent oxidoreductase